MADDLYDIPKPNREQTLALVGWLALSNAFGPVVREPVSLQPDELPTGRAVRWIGYLMSVARGRPPNRRRPQRQTVVRNYRRQVRARK